MGGVKGVGGKGGAEPAKSGKAAAKKGAFQAVHKDKGKLDKVEKAPSGAVGKMKEGGEAAAPARPQGFQVSKKEPLRPTEAVEKHEAMSAEVAEFAQGMVAAADAAAMPGPTTEGDLLPRESVSGLFVRDFVLQGAVALGRPPLGEDEAARIVIEKHIGGTPGLYYDAAVEPDGPDAFVVKLHRLDSNPPFLPDPNAEATYKIDRRTWEIQEVG